MTSNVEALETARRSYELRHRRLQQAVERLHTAKAELKQLFDQTFVHPNEAAAMFIELVKKSGLRRAVTKMKSDPTRPAPRWKALLGLVHPFDGINRDRERALENLGLIADAYREAEDAQQAFELTDKLTDEAMHRLKVLQDATEVIAPDTKHQQRRKLGRQHNQSQ